MASMNEMTKLDIDRVGKTFGGDEPVRALDAVDISIDDGEFVCIVGPSGCGKTTLFRIVAGLEPPTDGEIRLDGTAVTEPGPELGVVFQEYHLFPWLTVEENVGFGLKQQGVDKKERQRRVTEMLSLVGLADAASSYPSALSGGMKQRVAIARSLAVDPSLLLMDEPFGAVDARTKEHLQQELLEIWTETKKTILFITHDVDEAVALADRVVVMAADPGRVSEIVSIDVPRPRRRSDPAVGAYVEQIRRLIGARE
ncbi:ABC transporter ATP-binding protein [Natronocalculus amylovorans]|uniref:Molybdate/tungstate import ATP-binding protein WtpC n=1 Tax=Natronocalculus amylovorans TaxID=2917812 RepID=A0AAE3KB75_9EURY|nr:ABC transporter ATP-binding protein [Natronocalculus amylovorans]MCL9817274.1 ABC transporter ATP-binding protein [Natronocalculus amylovorans]NUE02698.1 ABC transporter ATP-binding protein [Halorubraceae archaeon YAN]